MDLARVWMELVGVGRGRLVQLIDWMGGMGSEHERATDVVYGIERFLQFEVGVTPNPRDGRQMGVHTYLPKEIIDR